MRYPKRSALPNESSSSTSFHRRFDYNVFTLFSTGPVTTYCAFFLKQLSHLVPDSDQTPPISLSFLSLLLEPGSFSRTKNLSLHSFHVLAVTQMGAEMVVHVLSREITPTIRVSFFRPRFCEVVVVLLKRSVFSPSPSLGEYQVPLSASADNACFALTSSGSAAKRFSHGSRNGNW